LFDALDLLIDALETVITALIHQSHALHGSFSILTSVLRVSKCVGGITAASRVAWMIELGTLTHRHITGSRYRPRNVLYKTSS